MTFDRDKGQIGGWLHGIVTNICCEHFRELNKHQHLTLVDDVPDRELPEPPTDLQTLRALLQQLAARQTKPPGGSP